MDLTIYGCELDEAAVFAEQAPALGIRPVVTSEPVSLDNIHLAVGKRCISVGHKTQITNEHLSALRDAGVVYISTRSIGFNHVDVAFAASIGITVGNVAYSPDSVGDHTLMLMLMTLRHAKSVLLKVDAHDYRLGEARGKELKDMTVGVVGTGRIGASVIERLKGFGCAIVANDSRPTTDAEYLELDELLQRSDIVTLHTPLDESSFHLLGARQFELMPSGSYLINTGRGALVDSDALLDALESGKLAGVGLDVVEGEEEYFYSDHRDKPVEEGTFSRLHRLPNVIITPHQAFYTERALKDTVVNSLINCATFERELQHG